ncbi:polysaccharide biosynthesis tyrosine autokinase [Blastopirellula retiformator]|uniref:non-specific protein-tyrosine kinase n=1 Tax=Blastopirellula retiformator TaxID=2527970 RepID=A0A5C5V8N3_9BACT|nr:polysaccharide biosynthesis tyrosine autokinase [Blastopirellula retiformator]TWT34641.1 Tyrosine-protein kinase YwqD [Blastopirellula retiformator]
MAIEPNSDRAGDSDEPVRRTDRAYTDRAYDVSPEPVAAYMRRQTMPMGEEPEDRTYAAVMHSLRRRWPLATGIGMILAVLASSYVWNMQRNVYRTSALVHIASDHTPLVFNTVDRAGRNPYEVFKSTQQQMITTRFVLNNALSQPEIAEMPVVRSQVDPVKWLGGQLQISFPGEAEIMQVSIQGGDPAVLAKLVNSVVDSYLDEVVMADRNRRLDRLADLEKQQGAQEDLIRKSGESISKLVEALGTSDEDQLTIAQQGVIADLNMTRNQLTKVRLARIAASAELGLLQSRLQAEAETPLIEEAAEAVAFDPADVKEDGDEATDGDVELAEITEQADGVATKLRDYPDTYVIQAMATDPEASPLLNKIDRLDAKAAMVETRFDEETAKAELPEIRAELAELQEKLEARKAELREELRAMRSGEMPQSTEERMELLTLQIVLADEQEKELQKSLDKLDGEVRNFGRKSIVLEMERSKLSAHKRISERLTEEILQLQVEINADPRIRSLSAAVEPKSFEHQSKMPKAMAAGAFFFLLPVCGLVWLDVRKQRIGCIKDLSQRTGVSILGAVPPTPRIGALRRQSEIIWREKLNDSISSIAATLIRKQHREGLKTVVVTSAVEGEGKTTLASHLSMSLAAGGNRVLLIDFDLRRPSLDELFEVDATPGICETLRGEVAWTDAVKPTEAAGVFLLPAGHWRGHVLEELASHRIQKLFDEFRSQYDFVLVDTSPVVPVVDARLVAQHADGALLSLMRDVSRLPLLESACEILESYNVPVLGAVLTGIETETYRAKTRRVDAARSEKPSQPRAGK